MIRTCLRRVLTMAAIAVTVALPAYAQIPTPESVIGWRPGTDYKLADYGQISDYFRQLDAASDRLILREIGSTAEGRPMMLAIISSEANLRQLDRWKDIARRLAMAQGFGDDEARALARDGKAIVWIDGGLHATEVAHAQHTPLLAHHLVASEDDEVRRIRDEAVVLLMPVMNPDGLEIVTRWYREHLGTPFETAPLPELYHKYVGHDNNRDWFMILQPETKAVTQQLWREWYPQIVYNHHQTGPFPSRIFIPPFKDPMNRNIPPLVMRGINLVGSAMGLRFAQEGKPGAISRASYTVWWNGGMRTAPYFHNQVGILTETNLYRYATPHYYDPKEMPKNFREGMSTEQPGVFYPNPWKGGWWRVGDAVDYMMTASMAEAKITADLKEDWLYNMYLMASRAREQGTAGNPFAYVIPPDQWDGGEALELVNVLRRGAVEVHRARRPFSADGDEYPVGSFIAFASQPFRAHLVDLMEPQDYPDRRIYPGGPPDPPYDMAGWTLPAQMGVTAHRIDEPFEASTEPVATTLVARDAGTVTGRGPVYLLTPNENAGIHAVNKLLASGANVSRASAPF
ncbi:MAG: M14 metallopeptidase family protein, partial [Acidimicrobiia bacterium]